MSTPDIPKLPTITNFPTETSIHLLLTSIALEELGLSHLINVEAEKIQSFLGTLHVPRKQVPQHSVEDLILLNKQVRKTLKNVIEKEMILLSKMQNISKIPPPTTTPPPPPTTPPPPPTTTPPPPPLPEVLAINDSVRQTLRDVIKKQLLLHFKIGQVKDIEP